MRNEEYGRPPKKFEDIELKTLLNESIIFIRINSVEKIQKLGQWICVKETLIII